MKTYLRDRTDHELSQHTAEIIGCVEAGATIAITRNGQPIAVICPYDPDAERRLEVSGE